MRKSTDLPSLQLVQTGHRVRWMGRLTLVFLVASIAMLLLAPWRQTARGSGMVTALDPQQRPQPVKTAVSGVVSWVKPGLREGSFVEQGEVIIRLEPKASDGVELLSLQVETIEAKKLAAEEALAFAQQNAIQQLAVNRISIEGLAKEIEAARQKWRQAESAELAKKASYDDKLNQATVAEAAYRLSGTISKQEKISKEQAAETAYQELVKAERYVQEVYETLEAKEKNVEAKREDFEIKRREMDGKVLDLKQKLNTIEKELNDALTKQNEQGRLKIEAPRSGRIQQWNGTERSDTLKEGETLFVIVPEADELSVEMLISGIDMPLIEEGDFVRLQFEGWPAVQFVGWPSVAIGTFGGRVNRKFPTDDGKGSFRVVVTKDQHFPQDSEWPDDRYLRQGVRANGWILLREVSLGYEIWRQLNGFPKSVEDKSEKEEKPAKVKLPKV